MAQIKNFPKLAPKKYAVALCSRNVWGVIMVDEKQTIHFEDGSSSDCWTGFACRQTVIAGWGIHKGKTFIKEVGDRWASREPHVIAYLDGVEKMSLKEILNLAARTVAIRNL